MINRDTLLSLLALAVRPGRADDGGLPDTSGKALRTGTVPTNRASIAENRDVLGQLWLLNAPEARPPARAHDPDMADTRRLLAAQARLYDELGADLAVLVSQQAAREWARLMQRCSAVRGAAVQRVSRR